MPGPDICRDCSLPRRVEELEARCEEYMGAFPERQNGIPDLAGHRDYHDRKIIAARAEEEFWRSLKLDIAKKGIWGGIIIGLGFLVAGALYILKKKLALM